MPGGRAVRSVQSKLHFMTSQKLMSICLLKVRSRSEDATSHCFHSTELPILPRGVTDPNFLAIEGPFSLEGKEQQTLNLTRI